MLGIELGVSWVGFLHQMTRSFPKPQRLLKTGAISGSQLNTASSRLPVPPLALPVPHPSGQACVAPASGSFSAKYPMPWKKKKSPFLIAGDGRSSRGCVNGTQGGCKPSLFAAESNLHELEEQKAPHWWLFPSRAAPIGAFWGSAPFLQLLALQEVGKWGGRAGWAQQPAVSRVSLAGAGAVPVVVPAWWPC